VRIPRKIVATLAVLAAIVGLAACGSSSDDSSGSASGSTTLRLWVSGPEYTDVVNRGVKGFERANPNIRVQVTNLDWSNYQQRIVTGIAGGTPPDVVSFYSTDLAPWASKGILAPVDEYLRTDQWQEQALNNARYDGKLYGFPWGVALRAFYYRNDLVEQAGLSGPPKNWADLRRYAVALTKRDASGHIERSGFWVPTNEAYKTPDTFYAFLWNNGGDVLSPDGTKATFNSPEGVQAAEMLAGLLRDDKVDEPGAITSDNEEYAKGQVAMIMGVFVTGDLATKARQLIPVTKIAVPPYQKEPAVETSGEVVGVTQAAKDKAAAAKLAEWLTAQTPNVVAHDEVSAYISAYKPALDSPYVKQSPFLPQLLPLVQYGRQVPQVAQYSQIEPIIKDALDSIYLQGTSAKQALDQAASQVDALLGS
jgi:multiple sugar transport system substrate-binding protein